MLRALAATSLLVAAAASPGQERPLCPATSTPHSRRLLETTCDDLRSVLKQVPGASVRRVHTTFLDERDGCSRQGCVVSLKGSFRKLNDQPSADVWLSDFLEHRGWSRTSSHDADGPDGTVYALHRPGALCIVEGRWNHWDDEEGAHTEDWYRITVSCGGAELEPRSQPEP